MDWRRPGVGKARRRSFRNIGGGASAWTTAALGSKRKLELIGGVGLTDTGAGKYSAWLDQSGNGFDASQGTDANRPAHGTINGLACPDFVGASTAFFTLGAVTQASLLTASAYEIWVVCNLDAFATRGLFGCSTEAKGVLLRTGVGTRFDALSWGTALDVAVLSTPVAGTTYMVGLRLSGGVLTLDALGTTATDGASTAVLDLTDTVRMIPDGRVGHVLACDAVLSTTERTQLKAYLAARYGAV